MDCHCVYLHLISLIVIRSEGFPCTGIFSPCAGRGGVEQDWKFFQARPPPPPLPSPPSAPKGSENSKIVRKLSETCPGFRQVRMHQNCAPNPKECLPDFKTLVKNWKNKKKSKNFKSRAFPYFTHRAPVGSPLLPIHTRCGVYGNQKRCFVSASALRSICK